MPPSSLRHRQLSLLPLLDDLLLDVARSRLVLGELHNLTDFDAELEVVEEPVFVAEGPGHRLMVRLDDVEAATVRELARARGVDEATLVREWTREHVPKAAG